MPNKFIIYFAGRIPIFHDFNALFYPKPLTFFSTALLAAQSGPCPLIQFCNHFSQTVGLLGWVIISSQGLYLITGQHRHRINTYTHTHQTSLTWVGFERTIPVSERGKTVHALDRAAAVTGKVLNKTTVREYTHGIHGLQDSQLTSLSKCRSIYMFIFHQNISITHVNTDAKKRNISCLK
jgi:hypothetical protein